MSQCVSSKLGLIPLSLPHNFFTIEKKNTFSHIYLLLQLFISFLPASSPCYNLTLAHIPLLRGKNWKLSQIVPGEKSLDPGQALQARRTLHGTSNEKHSSHRARSQVQV